ncbi:M20/M25/M40 family metallo-hydrolase [Sporosarcina highlanderae]|uniref:M20/M25/M40 family metallo-hydrolase n=1 Tax=Sporosarcina highlanderae TaxID=3035916 RepID=A0ABT8JSG3_9BACL|nr:M20/M25/M40 family metallo-hydrolase [Sporosarcina highlanderae]MDN4608105.1 M20/M25/M40 family metallo-hydrolase [Sporosarcina highlanderae]
MSKGIKVNEERLLESFIELAKINGPSGSEKPVADFIVPILEKLGFTLEFDEAHKNFGGDCGNLIAYWKGTNPSAQPLFFSTHLDTVLPTKGLQPVIKDGVIYTDGTTILGADDRAALAAYIEGIRVIQETGMPCGPIELVLTVNEQPGLVGATYLDYSKVRSKKGYIFDSSGDVGQIIQQGPFSSRFHCELIGNQSHIGLNPEEGINAFQIAAKAIMDLRLGQLDPDTLVNIGTIHGGEMSSIIPGEVKLVGEVRCFHKEGLEQQLDKIKDVMAVAAESYGGKANVRIEKKYLGFYSPSDSVLVQNAVQAAESIEVENYVTRTLGGADTNILNENGLQCITLGNGFRNIHTVNEHISIENLNNTARYMIGLVDEWYKTHLS